MIRQGAFMNHVEGNNVPIVLAARPSSLGERVRSLRLGERAPASGRGPWTTVIPWGIAGILLLTTLALGYRTYRITPAPQSVNSADNTGEKPGQTPLAYAPSSDGQPAAAGAVVLQSKGYVIPSHTVQVSPKVGGMLTWLDPNLEEGKQFKEGQLLATIEDVDYRTDCEMSQANLRNLEAQLERLRQAPRKEEIPPSEAKVQEAEANVVDLRDQLQRVEVLYSRRVINEEELVRRRQAVKVAEQQHATRKAEYNLLMAGAWKPDVLAAEALVKRAKADVAKAQWRLANTNVYAPINGTILSKKAEKGNLVNPSAYSNGVSANLCDMADLCDLEVELEIQQRVISRVVVGQRCLVVPEAYQNYEPFLKKYPLGSEGYVSRLMPSANRAKGSVPVRVKLTIPREEQGVYFKPDMDVTVSFKQPESQ
jgi:HlyD family secretion protein